MSKQDISIYNNQKKEEKRIKRKRMQAVIYNRTFSNTLLSMLKSRFSTFDNACNKLIIQKS